jgi:hypothetical protein
VPDDLHEWVSFEDPDEERTWIFDVTFLTSDWTCIFGRGCKGVLTEDYSEAVEGCCSYGAHFTGPEDVEHTQAMAERLSPAHWQFHAEGRRDGTVEVNDQGETVTRLVDDACVFLNRPGFPTGPGCAFHYASVDAGDRHLDWMPEVCWQLPLRRVDETDEHGHVTSTVREWKRRDWGDGGFEFHWWCTDAPDAFVGREAVYEGMREELVALVGEVPYDLLRSHLDERRNLTSGEVFLPHPARRVPEGAAGRPASR